MKKLRVAFMGSPSFAVPCLEALVASPRVEVALVVTQPDKPSGRGQKLVAPPVKDVAERAGIPVLQPPSLRKPPFVDEVRGLGLDLIVVVAYGKILPPDLLALPVHGCWNIHGSLLPRYRGAAPIQWAVLDGEPRTGVTLMQMEAGLDTGPMLLGRELEITPADTAGSVFERLAPLGAELLIEGLAALDAGTLVAVAQDERAATLAPMLEKEQGRVDFARPASRVASFIQGMDPWPGAYTLLDGEPLKLWKARAVASTATTAATTATTATAATGGDIGDSAAAPPGTVLGADQAGLRVACSDGAVLIGEAQLPGRKRMAVGALVGGRPIPRGKRLGS